MAVLVATERNVLIRAFSLRLVAAGKAKTIALIACLRKLLTILSVMVRRAQPRPFHQRRLTLSFYGVAGSAVARRVSYSPA